MKTFLRLLFFVSIVLLFSCEEPGTLVVNCSDCKTEEPKKTRLEIKINPSEFCPVQIDIYEGEVGDSIIYSSFLTCGSVTESIVPLNKKYTVTATYNINQKKYIAIDATTPRVRFEKDQCEEPCYFVYNRRVNLKLKVIHQ